MKQKIPLTLTLPPLYKEQSEMIDAFDTNPKIRYVIGVCGSKTGKSWGASHRIVRHAWNNKNHLCWFVAPTHSQCDNASELILSFLPKGSYILHRNPTVIDLVDPSGVKHSRIEFKSAQREEVLRGFGVNFLVVDEMSDISASSYNAFMTTITKTKGKVLYVGTPKGHNLFYDLYQRGNKSRLGIGEKDPYPEYLSFNLPTYANPFIDKESIDAKKKELTPAMFLQEIMASFIHDASTVFGKYKDCIVPGWLEEPKAGDYYITGVDIAQTQDWTVCTTISALSKRVVHFDRFNQMSWTVMRDRVVSIVRKYNSVAVVDATSIGSQFVEELAKTGIKIYPYQISGNSAKRDLIERLVMAIEHKKIFYPAIPEMLRELEDYEMNVTSRGIVQYSAPSGKHDDCCVSLALANYLLADTENNVYKTSSIRGV